MTNTVSSARSGASHIPALDGLRGAAILLVLVHHFTFYGGLKSDVPFDSAAYAVAMAGWIGVDLFFVLSGFLITRILYHSKGTTRYFGNFYARRCLRIFPLYYGVLALAFVVLPRIAGEDTLGPAYDNLLGEQSWYWTYLVNVRIAVQGWPAANAFGHFWSLAVEEQFYLVWPLLVFLLGRQALMRVCVSCVVLALGLRIALAATGYELAAYVLAPARMDALALGSLLALLDAPDGLQRWRRTAWLTAAAAGGLLTALALSRSGLWTEDRLTITAGLTLLAVFFAALLTLAVTSAEGSALGQLFSSRPLRFFGRYSYGLYVFHHPIAMLLKSHFTASDVPTVFGSRLPGLAMYSVFAAAASIAVALVSWHLYEQRFLRLKQRFRYSRKVRREATRVTFVRDDTGTMLPGPALLVPVMLLIVTSIVSR